MASRTVSWMNPMKRSAGWKRRKIPSEWVLAWTVFILLLSQYIFVLLYNLILWCQNNLNSWWTILFLDECEFVVVRDFFFWRNCFFPERILFLSLCFLGVFFLKQFFWEICYFLLSHFLFLEKFFDDEFWSLNQKSKNFLKKYQQTHSVFLRLAGLWWLKNKLFTVKLARKCCCNFLCWPHTSYSRENQFG